MTMKCRHCGKEIENADNPFRPFCSERCKLIDLGNWIHGSYGIPIQNADENGKPAVRKDQAEE